MTAPSPLDPTIDALFLDFDGTLTEIVERPDQAHLTAPRAHALLALPQRFGGAVAILSGRAIDDLTRMTSIDLWRVGGHGVETGAPGERGGGPLSPPAPALVQAAERLAARHPGVLLEHKPSGFAVHYRQNPAAGAECDQALEQAIAASPAHVLQRGKMVIEVKPRNADKGAALRRLMQQAPFKGRRPVMIGDDLTDEAAMRAALELGGSAIKIGEGDSIAEHRLASPDALYAFLAR